ncbi:MAG: HPr family phosphocarrier protein [Gammaproteobacteria bacterium]|nr:HPr family phosphocarrier protein [Gammaproteobacteria bacterium]
MKQANIMVINKLGMHARASAKFVNLASQFKSDIVLERNGHQANGKSIMGIMMLAAGKGSRLSLNVEGVDEDEAMQALRGLIENRFGEEE